jgi:hypothetical protein
MCIRLSNNSLSDLKRHWEALDDQAEVPDLQLVRLPLSVPALACSGTSTITEVVANPLFPERRETHGKE